MLSMGSYSDLDGVSVRRTYWRHLLIHFVFFFVLLVCSLSENSMAMDVVEGGGELAEGGSW